MALKTPAFTVISYNRDTDAIVCMQSADTKQEAESIRVNLSGRFPNDRVEIKATKEL